VAQLRFFGSTFRPRHVFFLRRAEIDENTRKQSPNSLSAFRTRLLYLVTSRANLFLMTVSICEGDVTQNDPTTIVEANRDIAPLSLRILTSIFKVPPFPHGVLL
jgi:hypothetical protein